MAAVSGSAFDIIGEWDMVVLLSDNIFDLLSLKSTALTCHLVMLYHRLVLLPIMCAKIASLLCPLKGYVNYLLPCAKFLWVQQYFGVGGVDDFPRPRLVPLLVRLPRTRPRPHLKLFP